MRVSIPLIAVLLLVVSCKNVGRTASIAVEDIGNAEVIDIPALKRGDLKYSDFCTKVEYIPLESTDRSAIGSITKMEVALDGSFIVFDVQNVLLLRFGPDGKFLNRIGMVGNKDGEYIQINDFAYDPYNNEVLVNHYSKSELLYYDLNGNFLRRSATGGRTAAIRVIDGSHLVFCKCEDNGGDSYDYKYVITSYDGNEVLGEFPDNELYPQEFVIKPYQFYSSSGCTYCKPDYSSSIYELSESGPRPAYFISYSDETIPPVWFESDYWSFIKKLSKDIRVAYCSSFYETDNYYLIESVKDKRVAYLSVQERSGAGETFSGSSVLDDMAGDKVIPDDLSFNTTPFVKCVSGNVFYSVIEPVLPSEDEYAEIRRKICRDVRDSVDRNLVLSKMDVIYRICQNDNPILIKCTLK